MYDVQLRDRLSRVQEGIERALQRAGRNEPVTIVGVTKGHPVEAVQAAIAVGLKRCGENRVAELEEKVETVGRAAIEWHLIGHLQRNKVKRAVPLFDLIHSVDSLRLAQELSAEAARAGVTVRGLAQVNVSGEETKGGFEATESLEPAVQEIAQVAELPHLEICGLMTMAPFTAAEAVLHQTFRRAHELYERCAGLNGFRPQYLSMGMSNDYEVAVVEGGNLVRLGTILFGERTT
jgi:pyridoxal phosphate enzyme (YggS family)